MKEELTLKTTMRPTYLIQRLCKPIPGFNNPFSFGGGLVNGGLSKKAMNLLRNIFSFDYMGSAEFEWGAVPAAFQFLAGQSNSNNLVTGKLVLNHDKKNNHVVYYVSPIAYEEEVKKRIKLLYNDKIDLKEHCGLREYFLGNRWSPKEGPQEHHKNKIGWLELDNGFIFFTDENAFLKFCKLFGIEPVKEKQ